MMIRFSCPVCHHTLKVPQGKAGAVVACPHCHERSFVPAGERAVARTGQPPRASMAPWGRPVALPWGLNVGRSLVALVVAVGTLSLLVAVLASSLHFSDESAATARQVAM